VGLRLGRGGVAGVALTCVLASAVGAAASHTLTRPSTTDRGVSSALPTPFAGNWNTTYPDVGRSGTLTLQVADAAKGRAAILSLAQQGGCSNSPTVYYTGSYRVTDTGDFGQVAGCTTDGEGLKLTLWYGGGNTGYRGTDVVSTQCADPNSFSGTFYETTRGVGGHYDGTRSGTPQPACDVFETVKFAVSASTRFRRGTIGNKAAFLQTTVRGLGQLVFPGSGPLGATVRSTTAKGSIQIVEVKLGGPKVIDIDVLTLRVTSGEYKPPVTNGSNERSAVLLLDLTVSKSATTGCPVGAAGAALLIDGESSRKADEAELSVNRCRLTARAVSGTANAKVAVVIQGSG